MSGRHAAKPQKILALRSIAGGCKRVPFFPAELSDTNVDVIEIAPPYVQTELMGERQASDPQAMPLSEFIDEVMSILEMQPSAREVLVGRVHPLRFAAEQGYEKYMAQFHAFNDHHGAKLAD